MLAMLTVVGVYFVDRYNRLSRGLSPAALAALADPTELNFVVIGDFGAGGTGGDVTKHNQLGVASALSRYTSDYPVRFDAVLSTGDQIYHSGVETINDPAFTTVFEDV